MAREERSEVLISQLELAVLRAARSITAQREALAKRMGQSLTRWQLLSESSQGERTVPQLARRLALTRQSVQRTADKLVAEGLAAYRANPDHVRSPHLLLTRRGESVLAVLQEGLRREQVERGSVVAPEQLRQVLALLEPGGGLRQT